MADFDKPDINDQYVTFDSSIRENQDALAVMFNGVQASNIPVNSVQFQGGKFSLWDGAAWNDQPVSIAGGGTGATNASEARGNLGVRSDTENDAKFMAQSANGSDIDDKSIFRSELDVYSKSEVDSNTLSQISFDDDNVNSGDITGGEIHARKIGDKVTIWGKFLHSSDTNPTTADGFLPLDFRNTSIAKNTYSTSAILPNIRTVSTSNSGAIAFAFLDSSFSGSNDTDTDWFSISYVIA